MVIFHSYVNFDQRVCQNDISPLIVHLPLKILIFHLFFGGGMFTETNLEQIVPEMLGKIIIIYTNKENGKIMKHMI